MHHKRDWSKYNRELVNRGKINFWVNPQILQTWGAKKQKKNGHPFVYADEWIQTICFIRFKFHLSLRETEGFFLSLLTFLGNIFRVPCYTQISRRMKTLGLPSELLEKKHVTDIVLDTTGLKVYGAGEWRSQRYGGKKRWKKIHLAMDLHSGKLVFVEITDEYTHDTQYLELALQKMNQRKGEVLFDGIADSQRCYELAERYNKQLLTPPKEGAILREESCFKKRNEAIRIIKGLGGDRKAKSLWGKLVGYNRRVLVESMIAKWKQLFGGRLRSNCERRRKVEVQLKAEMMNRMTPDLIVHATA